MRYRPPSDWDHWSEDRIRHEQGRRLRRFVAEQLVPFSPFYRKLFRDQGVDPRALRSVEDLQRLPFTSKEDIAPSRELPDRPRDLVLQPTPELIRAHWGVGRKLPLLVARALRGGAAVRRELAREYRPVSVFFTTGRSALPTAFTLSSYDLAILEDVGRRIVEVARVDPSTERLVNLFPFAPHLAFWQVYYVGIGGNVFTLNTGGGKVMGTPGILQAIEKIRPAYIAGIPGYIYHLLREAHGRGMQLGFVKGLALGGDQVSPAYRERVKSLLCDMGARAPRVHSVLGFTESRKCWAECCGEPDDGFHTYPDLEIVEIVDPETGKPVGAGETGELVYTALDGRGSCVLRYRTGDLIVGGLRRGPCPHCGRTVPRLSTTLQRVSNLKSFQLSKVKGTLVNLNVLREILDNDPRLEEWQLVIRKRGDDPFEVDEIILNLALRAQPHGGSEEAVAAQLEQRIFEVSELRLNEVRILPLAEILDLLGMETQLKEKRIVDLRTGAAAAHSKAASTSASESRS